jgi:hypothetical protein
VALALPNPIAQHDTPLPSLGIEKDLQVRLPGQGSTGAVGLPLSVPAIASRIMTSMEK